MEKESWIEVMEIRYTDEKYYTQEQVQALFQSVNWLSGNYPERLMKALDNCETVFTAWYGEQLVGIINAIDDGELTAYAHYLCVHQKYQGYGIGRHLLELLKEKYNDYLYLILIAEHDSLVEFYRRNGFDEVEGTHVVAIQNK